MGKLNRFDFDNMRDEFPIMVSSDSDNEADHDSADLAASERNAETLEAEQKEKACLNLASKTRKEKNR